MKADIKPKFERGFRLNDSHKNFSENELSKYTRKSGEGSKWYSEIQEYIKVPPVRKFTSYLANPDW